MHAYISYKGWDLGGIDRGRRVITGVYNKLPLSLPDRSMPLIFILSILYTPRSLPFIPDFLTKTRYKRPYIRFIRYKPWGGRELGRGRRAYAYNPKEGGVVRVYWWVCMDMEIDMRWGIWCEQVIWYDIACVPFGFIDNGLSCCDVMVSVREVYHGSVLAHVSSSLYVLISTSHVVRRRRHGYIFCIQVHMISSRAQHC